MKLVSQRYRVGKVAASAVVVTMVVGLALVGVVGCGGFADQARQDASTDTDDDTRAMETAVDLYESMVVVFRRDTEGIEVASEETLTVVSVYEPIAEERRRRFVGQIVPVGGGIGVRITAEYQNEVHHDDELVWEDEPREEVEAEASPLELSMARSVEREYHKNHQ